MDTPLGKATEYSDTYAPGLLAPMSRATARAAIGLSGTPPFRGEDVWNGYELSWLGNSGAPQVAGLRLVVDAASPYFVESKSFKLYLNSFAQSRFPDWQTVARVLEVDLATAFGSMVSIELVRPDRLNPATSSLPGLCLDDLVGEISVYQRAPELLASEAASELVRDRAVHTHAFRSLCPVTGQPDWASVLIRYSGPLIRPESLYRYLISYRLHPAFHETTIEQIFIDIREQCSCSRLTVAGFFQRRGGLDINPVRTDENAATFRYRLPRQ